jgi:hypothetical protein
MTASTGDPDATLSRSRQTLRQLLLPRPRGGNDTSDEFLPRSKTMRALMNPEKRWVWMASLAVASLMLPRVMGARRVGTLFSAYSAIRRALDLSQSR